MISDSYESITYQLENNEMSTPLDSKLASALALPLAQMPSVSPSELQDKGLKQ